MAIPTEQIGNSRTVLMQIRAALPQLRPSERRIGEFLLEDPVQAAALSMAQIAEKCETSTTSVVRFYTRIGFTRFQNLKHALMVEATREQVANSTLPAISGDIDKNDTIEDIVDKVVVNGTLSISDTAEFLDLESLQKAVSLIGNAQRTEIFGVGASSVVAHDLHQKLIRIGYTALTWSDAHAAWTSAVTLDKQCVAIAISHSGQTEDCVEYLRLAQETGAHTVAITNYSKSSLAQYADIVLTTAAREPLFRSGALGSRIAQLVVVDCLFIGVAQESFDESMAALRKTYAAVHRKHLER